MTSNSPVSMRLAQTEDVPELHRIYRQLESPGGGATLERLTASFDSVRAVAGYEVWVATREERIVGTFALLIIPTLGDRCAPAGVVEDVVVDAAERGHGIGRRMIEFALERCREAGCYKLALSTNLRRKEAHRFYQSLGFKRHGYSFVVELESSDAVEGEH